MNTDLHKWVTERLTSGLGIHAVARHAECSTITALKIKDLAKG
jgi:hypothetical protein